MNLKSEIKWWEKFTTKGEELGYRVVNEAASVTKFLKSLRTLDGGKTYISTEFDDYIQGHLLGYQFNNSEYENIHLMITHDLHSVRISEGELDNFLFELKESPEWADRIFYAYHEAKVF